MRCSRREASAPGSAGVPPASATHRPGGDDAGGTILLANSEVAPTSWSASPVGRPALRTPAEFASSIGTPALPAPDARRLLKRILYWTGGHPYLTQRLAQAVAEKASVRGAGE